MASEDTSTDGPDDAPWRRVGLDALWRRRASAVLQTEAAECGLACLAMVLGWHGVQTDLRTLRQRHSVSMNGLTLAGLARIAAIENLGSRAVRLDLDEMAQLRLPCILHWEMSHFVVLTKVDGRGGATILDPAHGQRTLGRDELSRSFTGVALELWPAPELNPRDERQPVRLARLLGRVGGFGGTLARILALSAALEVFALVTPLLMQWVTDQVLVARDGNLLTVLALGFAMLMVVRAAVSLGRGWLLATASAQLTLQWRGNVLAHLMSLPTLWFQKRHLGDVVSRMRAVDSIQSVLASTFVEAALDGVMTVVALTMMMLYSPTLALVSVAFVVAYALARVIWLGPQRRAHADQVVREARQSSHLLETIRGVRTLKMFGRQRERLDAWQALLADELTESLRVQSLRLTSRAVGDTLAGLGWVLVVWLGAREVMNGQLSLGMLLAFVAYRTQFSDRTSELIGKLVELRMLRVDMERLADIVLSRPEPASVHVRPVSSRSDLTITLDQVSFRYADHEPPVLVDVSLRIVPGELVAITGPSGCGKTTLVGLLLGDLQPTQGIVRIGRRRVLEPKVVPAWRTLVGTVLQDDALFAGSVADNICCFDPTPDMQQLLHCVHATALAGDLARMPMGLNTLVGDMGTTLSGGQRQRVLLARALYKRPRVLLLDEATAHLDVGNEHHVMQALDALAITRIVVAHRPETVASADRVIELRDGRVFYDGPSEVWRSQRDAVAALAGLAHG